ncbi:Phosphotransferase enzyme family protein [Caballeronia glebae]|jgi:aminoglycoside phosphotransferase (APT) family kinase protein|uniref:Phosphotransferase enzyme family protein n=1 Tax=Caballeronia glebae TaxID=1777143 RepID=A0A158DEA7_9BURK|nr:aminoglycoside phosphotransferase family protein [Caballeronia glebae]SAK92944.1 Phosphotransferase enzyme family protein [Caballeronia glebae]
MVEDELTHLLQTRFGQTVRLEKIGGTIDRTAVYRVKGNESVAKLFFHAAQIKHRREVTAYEFLRSSRVAIPRLVDSGMLPSGVPWILISQLSGAPISELRTRFPDVARQMTGAMAGTLAQLHRLPADRSPLFVGERDLAELLAERLTKYAGFAATAAALDLPEKALLRTARDAMLRLRLDERGNWARKGVFVHGDFSMRNLLADMKRDGTTMTGLIDFERARLGDPAEDLCAAFLGEFYQDAHGWTHFLDVYRRQSHADDGLHIRFLYFFIGHVAEIATWAPGKDDAYYQNGLRALESLMSAAKLC